jgi:hypothetical protein
MMDHHKPTSLTDVRQTLSNLKRWMWMLLDVHTMCEHALENGLENVVNTVHV